MSSREERATSTSTSEKSPRSERNVGATDQLLDMEPRMFCNCDEMVEDATDTSSLPRVADAMYSGV